MNTSLEKMKFYEIDIEIIARFSTETASIHIEKYLCVCEVMKFQNINVYVLKSY